MTLLKVTGISKKGEGDFLLQGISFSQRKLERIAIAGETGAGKSTLLKIIAGLIQPDSGQVIFENRKVTGPNENLVAGTPGIAYLSQHFELQKFLRVEQVLSYSNSISDTVAQNLYQVCQIDHLLKRKTDQLSGGEKQRIAICRLLISSPRLLLLDEPFSHLDMVHKNTLKTVINEIGIKLKITCVLVSHDPHDSLSWADKIIIMKDGSIIQQGTPESVYAEPASQYAGGLLGNYNLISPSMFKNYLRIPAMRSHALKAGKKSIFIRPENFKVVNRKETAIRCTVSKVSFLGGYYELEVSTSKNLLLVKTDQSNIKTGDTVYVSASRKSVWLL